MIYGEAHPAQLLRSHAPSPFLVGQTKSEVIGQGPLWKMVRAAVTDPDGELWRYSILVGKDVFASDKIRTIRMRNEE